MSYPRPIECVRQIEVTSKCNLKCVYCPSKRLPELRKQPPTFMTMDHFKRALEWAKVLNEPTDPLRAEIGLTGIGEALMHPDFVEMVRLTREALPENPITFSTNGILLTEKMCEQLAPYNPRIYVSLHRPEKAAHAINAARKYGLLDGYNPAAATDAFAWAGAVDWPVSANPITCEFLRSGWGVVLADGRWATCCLDAEGASVVGHVDDPIGSLFIRPWSGDTQSCEQCHMVIEEPIIRDPGKAARLAGDAQ